MRLVTIALGLLVGCAKPAAPVDSAGTTPGTTPPGATDTSAGSPATTPDTDADPGPLELTGTTPAVALPPIEFTDVVNEDVQVRSKADLLGHPTVMWFYPAAGTGG